MDYRYKHTNAFRVFITTYLPSRSEINRKANVYQNFLDKDGTPKSKSRHKIKGKYTLSDHRNKIVDDKVKRKFDAIRKHLKNSPSIQEEYTKRRLSYWISNRCLCTLEPHRKNLWLGITGKRQLRGYKKYFDHNKTYFRIDRDSNIENVVAFLDR